MKKKATKKVTKEKVTKKAAEQITPDPGIRPGDVCMACGRPAVLERWGWKKFDDGECRVVRLTLCKAHQYTIV